MHAVLALIAWLELEPAVAILLLAMLVARLVLGRSAKRRPVRRTPGHTLLEWLDAGLLATGLVFLVIRPFIGQVVSVSSASMTPTLRGSSTPQIDGPNDRLVLVRYLYHLRAPRRGEIVVFRLSPENTDRDTGDVVKRVIALPGDKVGINSTGHVVLNGQQLRETDYTRGPSNRILPVQQVPPGHLFVLGDNRTDSRDSSRFERSPFVDARLVKGKAVAICWPPERVRLLP